MMANIMDIYVKVKVSGRPTEMDSVGCDGLFIEGTEMCTKEITALKRENEALREYIPEHILKEWEYYRALLADTQDTENNKCAEPTDNAEVLHTKESE